MATKRSAARDRQSELRRELAMQNAVRERRRNVAGGAHLQPSVLDDASVLRRMLRAAVKAALPGRQSARNVAEALREAEEAARRVLRRSKE